MDWSDAMLIHEMVPSYCPISSFGSDWRHSPKITFFFASLKQYSESCAVAAPTNTNATTTTNIKSDEEEQRDLTEPANVCIQQYFTLESQRCAERIVFLHAGVRLVLGIGWSASFGIWNGVGREKNGSPSEHL